MNYNYGFQLGYPLERLHTPTESSTRGYAIWILCQRVLAACLLLCVLPLFALVWVVNLFGDRGPLFFIQTRRGLDCKPFKVFKLRTMRVNSERHTALGTQVNSPQVTRIGRPLRKLKIDELPQLINIVRGEMALVGPRPIPTALDQELCQHIHGFDTRYAVYPGLTSIGQICIDDNALGDQLVGDWKLRFEGELHYIRSQSICYDLMMIGMTVGYIFKKLLKH
jgi:lipopolysaccharide/colanic/teichoic acid biosynthesis glycosyltransferase